MGQPPVCPTFFPETVVSSLLALVLGEGVNQWWGKVWKDAVLHLAVLHLAGALTVRNICLFLQNASHEQVSVIVIIASFPMILGAILEVL